ncbi:MAG TPA: hypothetical protein H9754_03520 [Candidatus Anaerostipes avistercoris]|uniref:Uncharacterized protein n=1 Tax=Candidatus Anaerostipes avistercoris TaxID=2838462 RepID=A0A9D2PF14_9FIRM|nr:hypothetical protein [Candidatus Anaerostipes avistercoris]
MKILLISEKKRVFEKTESITRGWAEIIWYKYDDLKRNEYPVVNAVIIQFDNKMLKTNALGTIIKIKGIVGANIPILVLMNGTPQEIFSVLKAGAYDYIINIDNTQKYRKKIEDIILWNWYCEKYKI